MTEWEDMSSEQSIQKKNMNTSMHGAYGKLHAPFKRWVGGKRTFVSNLWDD